MFIDGLTCDAYLPKRIFMRCILHAAARRGEIKFYSQNGLNFKIFASKKHVQKVNSRFAQSFFKTL
ncbi:hypothetical protein CGRAC_0335 [Campylobacter gracilis]|nr:hypothetical protein CGRAC_0335 [Campylobacter gracilis]